MSEPSKLSKQRPPPLAPSDADTPFLTDRQALSRESSVTSEPDSVSRGTTKSKRSSILGSPAIPQTLSPSSLALFRPAVPLKSSLLSAFASPAAHPFPPPSAPKNRAFARSQSCSMQEAAAMQAAKSKEHENQRALKHAKTALVPLRSAPSILWQAEDKSPSSVRLLRNLHGAPRGRPSLEERMSSKSDNSTMHSLEERTSTKSDNSTRPHWFLPPEVIRTPGSNGFMAPDSSQSARRSAFAPTNVAAAALSSTHSGLCSPVSDDGAAPFQPTPPNQQPCAFRRTTILNPIHHIRQSSQKGLSPSRGSFSDIGTGGVEIRHHHHHRHHHHQQQQQQEQQQQLGPHLEHTSVATSLSGAPSLTPQASSIFLAGGASKRGSSGIQKQVRISLDHEFDDAEAGTAVCKDARRRSTGQVLSRPCSPLAGVQRLAEGMDGGVMGRHARWISAEFLGTEDSPLSRELTACERERRLRLRASQSCKQLAQANARANPSAFCVECVEEEEAKRGLAAEAAQQSLRVLEGRPSNDMQAVDQFHTKVRLLRASRSFYHAPEAEKQQVTRASLLPRQGPWTLEHSLFQQRALETDARNIFDTPEVLDAQFANDWQRICQKGGLAQAIAAATVGPAAQHEKTINRHSEVVLQLEEVRRELRNRIHILRSCFIFFAALAPTQRPHELMAMRMQDFCGFTRSCNLSDPRSPTCKPPSFRSLCTPPDMEAVFKACKGPAALSGVQQEGVSTPPHHLLDRSEFLECIVRLAIVKHIRGTHATGGQPNVADAVEQLLEEDIQPKLSPSAKVDANAFRKDRLYSEEMEVCIRSHWDLLKMAFKVYSAGGDVLGIEGWLALLAAGALLGRANHTGIDKHAAKVVFMLSQATVVDEQDCPQSRHEGLTFFDYVEALARLSEVLCAPPPEELSSLFRSKPPVSRPISAATSEHLWMALMDQPSIDCPSELGPASTTSIANPEAATTLPPLLSPLSDSCVARETAVASALPQLTGRPKSAAGIESAFTTPKYGSNSNNNNDNSSSGGSQTYSAVHTFFKDMLQWPQLCKYRMQEAGLDKALHMTACQRPLLDCFEPMMELFESGMRRTWGGQSQADTIAKMKASLGLQG